MAEKKIIKKTIMKIIKKTKPVSNVQCRKCGNAIRIPSKRKWGTPIKCLNCLKKWPTRNQVKKGTHVSIQKENNDDPEILTEGIVAKILTPYHYHSEGLLVDLENGIRGRVKKITGSIKQDSSYAAKIFTKDDDLNKIPNSNEDENSEPEKIFVSKDQAKLLKTIAKYLPNEGDLKKFEYFKEQIISEKLKTRVELEWDTMEEFYDLSTSYEKPNQIYLVVIFEKLKEKLGRVPTKDDVNNNLRVSVETYENEFKDWESFLDRIGYDPWHKTTTKPLKSDINEIKSENENNQTPKKAINFGEKFIESQKLMDEMLLEKKELQDIYLKLKEKLNYVNPNTIRKILRKL